MTLFCHVSFSVLTFSSSTICSSESHHDNFIFINSKRAIKRGSYSLLFVFLAVEDSMSKATWFRDFP